MATGALATTAPALLASAPLPGAWGMPRLAA
jgi:hypothetical protein